MVPPLRPDLVTGRRSALVSEGTAPPPRAIVTPLPYGVAVATHVAVPTGRLETSDFISELQVGTIAALLRDRFRDGVPVPARWDDPLFWNVEASPEDRCQYLAVGNAINFRFWTSTNDQLVPSTGTIEGENFRGSMYMWRRLRLATERSQLTLDAKDLARLTQREFERAFVDDEGRQPLAPGISDRVANLQDLGARLVESWDGQFKGVVDAACGSLDGFVKLCSEFRAFDDPVRKLIMVNAIMLTGSGLAEFDADPLPGIDYHLVKQALRQGLVIPPPELVHKLAANEMLDSDESRILRSAVLVALTEVAKQAGIPTTVLDNLYWLNKRVCAEVNPSCSSCPFESGCSKRTEYGLPMEMTRYY